MTDPRKLMARLGAASPALVRQMQLGTHVVSMPDFSAQDIAAALTQIENKLARRIYEWFWWPAYSTASNSDEITKELVNRFARHINLKKAQKKPSGFPQLNKAITKKGAIVAVKRIAHSALVELAHRNDCKHCHGYGLAPITNEKKIGIAIGNCPKCAGNGVIPISKSKRAKLIGIRYSTYINNIQPYYDWFLNEIKDLEAEAVRQHSKALSNE